MPVTPSLSSLPVSSPFSSSFPQGYDRDFYRTRKRDGVPVLYFLDGQGAIRDDDSPSGSSWRAAETAAALIRAGELPPFIIVAIDGAGTSAQTKSLQFLPYPPGAADGEFRRDTENWPGGGVAPLLERIVHEIVPMVAREFGGSTGVLWPVWW